MFVAVFHRCESSVSMVWAVSMVCVWAAQTEKIRPVRFELTPSNEDQNLSLAP